MSISDSLTPVADDAATADPTLVLQLVSARVAMSPDPLPSPTDPPAAPPCAESDSDTDIVVRVRVDAPSADHVCSLCDPESTCPAAVSVVCGDEEGAEVEDVGADDDDDDDDGDDDDNSDVGGDDDDDDDDV